MTFAAKIKELRVSKGLSMIQLEKNAGITHTMISSWERGIYQPSKENLNKLIRYFKLPQDYFLDCYYEKKTEVNKHKLSQNM